MSVAAQMAGSATPWEGAIFSNGWSRRDAVSQIVEPATGSILGTVGVAGAADVRAAAAIAAQAQPEWEATSFEQRGAILRAAARQIETRFGEFAEWIMRETGSSRLKAEFEVGLSIRAVYDAAAMPAQPNGLMLPSETARLSYAKRRALGVVGIISPFNFPFFLGIRSVAPALAVGNAVIIKPNPLATVSGGMLFADLLKKAGLPDGVFHVVPGDADVGEAMCADPDVAMIQFVGSTAVGRKVGEAASRHLKKVSLEMGGKNSLVILDDADLDLAAANAAWASFLHQGQICFAAGRTLVQRSIADEFIEKLVAKARAIRVGNPTEEGTMLGPLISDVQCRRAVAIVDAARAAGATIHHGGTADGLFFQPTVMSGVTSQMQAYHDEIFAPVATITTFDTDEEAIALANDTEYGLSGAVISRSIGRALAIGERLRVGIVHVNDQTIGDEAVNPIAGWGASGNGSGVGGPANWDEFSRWQWYTIKDSPPPYPLGMAG
ncbi:aldehyde dehydrogenase family protein [Novosphingobium pentaromativorans]|nr:aldehyde dehydrogenase family protein [Novosphingobium pentaromativorans]AIT82177.1 benzaldehyde dehydrogenase [Novosphingobium pentaromativorans US6-1]